MPISMKEHKEKALKRENYFKKMIMVNRKVSEKKADEILRKYKSMPLMERKEWREREVEQYQKIAYADKPTPAQPKNVILKEKAKPRKYTGKDWYNEWLSDRGIKVKNGKAVGKVSSYEKRIIGGYEKNKHLNPTLTDLRGH